MRLPAQPDAGVPWPFCYGAKRWNLFAFCAFFRFRLFVVLWFEAMHVAILALCFIAACSARVHTSEPCMGTENIVIETSSTFIGMGQSVQVLISLSQQNSSTAYRFWPFVNGSQWSVALLTPAYAKTLMI
jgi:hypothetical protein